jgi:predicted HTH domain antitoxin
MAVQIQDLVQAGVYPDVETAVQEALRVLWQERPQVRIDVAVHRYRTEDLSVAKAAALAGVSFDRMKKILAARMEQSPSVGGNVPLRLGSETVEEACAEMEAFKRMRP